MSAHRHLSKTRAVVFAVGLSVVTWLTACAPVAVPTPRPASLGSATPSTSSPRPASTSANYYPQPDSTPGEYYLGSLLGTALWKDGKQIRLDSVGRDAQGAYGVFDGVILHVGESHHFDGIGTITVLRVSASIPCGQATCPPGGSGDTASVLFQPD